MQHAAQRPVPARHKVSGELRQTTDPGRAIRSGSWEDIDRFKTPSLRGVAARAPYFHNGVAKTLKGVVLHYEKVFGFRYTEQEREDLVAFMEALSQVFTSAEGVALPLSIL